jgi:hypothetical protein
LHLPHFQIPVECLFTLLHIKVDAKLAATNTDNQHQHLRVLSAESAAVGGVLGDFHLLDHLTQSSAISGAVLAANSDLLGVVSLHETPGKVAI